MPKRLIRETYLDGFLGGLVSNITPDTLSNNILVNAQNVRVADWVTTSASVGAVVKRPPFRRMHANAIGTAPDRIIDGVFQWDAPGGAEIVAIASGRLYHKQTDEGEFTEVIPGTAIAGGHVSFVTFRESSSGAPLVLYFAVGGQVWKWDGTTLTQIDGVNNVPAASLLAVYGTRVFAAGVANFPKHIFWSTIGDAEDFTTGGASQGGSAMVDVLSGDAITSLNTFGSSLMIFTEDSLVRLTGVSNEDIQISQDIAGIVNELGARHKDLIVTVDDGLMVYTRRGIYKVTESAINPISLQIIGELPTDNPALDQVVAGSYHANDEVWFYTRGPNAVYVYLPSFTCWTKWVPAANTYFNCASRFRGSTVHLEDGIMLGGTDGFVRTILGGASTNYKDDQAAVTGAGGTAFTSLAEFASPFRDNHNTKTIRRMWVQASCAATPSTTFYMQAEEAGEAFADFGAGVSQFSTIGQPRTVRLNDEVRGERLRIQVTDKGADIGRWALYGFSVEAWDLGRP